MFPSPLQILAGAVVVSGELEAMVTATGVNSFFGKTMALLAVPPEVGHLQQVRFLPSVCVHCVCVCAAYLPCYLPCVRVCAAKSTLYPARHMLCDCVIVCSQVNSLSNTPSMPRHASPTFCSV